MDILLCSFASGAIVTCAHAKFEIRIWKSGKEKE